jgi:hypothetical protein
MLQPFRVISFATPHYAINRLRVPQVDAQEVLHNVYSYKMAPQARVIRHHSVYRGENTWVLLKRLNQGTNETEGKLE